MADEIYFTTDKTREGTVFNIMPPQPSKFVSAVIYLAAVIVIGSLLKSIRSFHQIDQLLIGLVFWCGLFFLLIKSRMKYLEKMLPFTITAVPEGLLVQEIFYPREDIAELSLFAPGARVSANSFAVVGGGVVGALSVGMVQGALNAGQLMAAKNDARSYRLMLRKRSISKPVQLVEGLTHQTGEALMNDIYQVWR
jgi:hypothetical protein